MAHSRPSVPLSSAQEDTSGPQHRIGADWLRTSGGEKRGYIDPLRLRELWFHTGTACNLRCPDCFEHSAPGDQRLEPLLFDEAKCFIDEAVALGIEQFSFTGGEPFVARDLVRILDYALEFRPCLVLTNGTSPLRTRLDQVRPLRDKPNALSFRVSLDYSDPDRHDAGRGDGMFDLALDSLVKLHQAGFRVSVARRHEDDEDPNAITDAYRALLSAKGLPVDTPIVAFPDLERTGSPEITENCMTTYHSPESCGRFMCAFSRMVVKQGGCMRVYACTLVDDNPHYDLGSSLAATARTRVRLEHPRCFACFATGASCSEL